LFIEQKKIFGLLLIILLVWICLDYSFAQSVQNNRSKLEATGPKGSIKGKLLDHSSQRPLFGADVSIPGTTMITITDLKGEFSFENIPVGSYSLKFTYPQMEPQVKTDIIVKSKRTTFVTTEIQLIPVAEETVTVTAGYFSRSPEVPASSVNFSYEEIRRAPGSGGDVNRIIAGLPSIAKVSDQVNNLAVRGGSASENLFMIDNIEIPNINHFPFLGSSGGAISLLNVDFIEKVDFYTGGFSPIYGDKLSSVMDLSFREGNRENFDGQVSLDMGGAALVLEGPLFNKKGSWMFSARRSYLDLLTDLLDAGAAVRYSDFQGKLVQEFSPGNKITFLGIMGNDKSTVTQEDAAELGENSFGVSRNHEYTTGINWFLMWSDKGYSNTSISRSYTKYDNDNWKTVNGARWLRNLSKEESWHLRNVNHYNFSYGHNLQFGFELKRIISKYDYFMPSYISSLGDRIPEVQKQIHSKAGKYAAFLEYSLSPFPKLTLNLGVRGDYFDFNKHFKVSPRASLTFQVSKKTSIGAAAGIFRQNLPLLLLYQNEANRNLEDPMTYQYTVNLSHLLRSDTRLTIEAYYKFYRYFPVDPAQPTICLLDEIFSWSKYGDTALVDSGKAQAYGIEFILQKKMKEKFYGMISGSLSRTRYKDINGIWHDRLFDNRYIFSVQGGYKPNKKWEFSVRWIIAGGLPYTPFDVEASQEVNSGIFDNSRINAERLPAYHNLNLRFDKRIYFRGSNLTLYFSVWNAYNRKNVAGYFWNETENKADYSYQFSILPILGIEYEF